MSFAFIYALLDDRGNVRYIGKANNPEKRYKQHLRDCNRRNTPLYSWIRKLVSNKDRPYMLVLCSAISDDWESLEIAIIKQYQEYGTLLNLAEGGNQPKSNPAKNKLNAQRLNERIHGDPFQRRVWNIKRAMGEFLRRCDKGKISKEREKSIKDKLIMAGNKRPDLFGNYRYLTY